MRSLFARFALAGLVGALVGCGSQNGTPLPYGGAPNGAGGGPTNYTTQNPPAGTIASKLIDGGSAAKFAGFNATAVDTVIGTAAQPTNVVSGNGTPVADLVGEQSLAVTGNGTTVSLLKYSTAVNLTYSGAFVGQLTALTYGAIVFYATPPAGVGLTLELAGGSGASQYDVRLTCTGTALTAMGYENVTTRYVCPLPAYGSSNAAAITGPAVASFAPGAFTPTSATLYLVETSAAASTAATTAVVDYFIAEQSAK